MVVSLKEDQNRIYSLQALRAIAALMVVFFHVKGYSNILEPNANTLFQYVFSWGGYGALLFFSISGFIMAYLIDHDYKNFLLRRLLRIYPPFIIATVLIIYVKVLVLHTITLNYLISALTLLPFGTSPGYALNIEWTLVYEVFFYFICAIFAFKVTKKWFIPFLLSWYIAIIVGNRFFNMPTDPLPTIFTIPFSTLNYFFICGALVYFLKKKYILRSKLLNLILIILLAIIMIYSYNEVPLSKGMHYLLFSAFFGGIIFIVSNFEMKKENILVKCGNYSYGIYLVHAEILYIVFSVWKSNLGQINTMAGLLALICALVGGWYYGKFENNLHYKIKNIKLNQIKEKISGINPKYAIVPILCVIIIAVQYTQNSIAIYALSDISKFKAFDESKIVHENICAGWVENFQNTKVNYNENIDIYGWAIDPYKIKVAKDIVIESNGKIIPIKVRRLPREGLAELYKSSDVSMSGFELSLNSVELELKENKIEIYAVTIDNKYIQLKETQPIIITVNR